MKYLTYVLVILTVFGASCSNEEWEFPDYEYQAVYFAHQYPIRTITLGEDIFDTSMDNEWKFMIMATTGGVYENQHDIMIDVEVNNAMTEGLNFDAPNGGGDMVAMPSNYYTMSSDQIAINKGNITGGLEVQLTQAFFDDPRSIQNTFVIPMRMKSVQSADSILSGASGAESPRRGVPGDWAITPKDFVFYAVKYINPWDGYYLRRGADEITKNGVNSTDVRHETYVESDEVWQLSTLALDKIEYPMGYKNREEQDLNLAVQLNFDNDEKVTVSEMNSSYQLSDSVRVYNISATGSGKFVKDGEKQSWGNQDRDALYLDYEVDYTVEINYPVLDLPTDTETVHYSTTDTLVVRNRGVVVETFTPTLE